MASTDARTASSHPGRAATVARPLHASPRSLAAAGERIFRMALTAERNGLRTAMTTATGDDTDRATASDTTTTHAWYALCVPQDDLATSHSCAQATRVRTRATRTRRHAAAAHQI
eukprot:COSAG02_NODE_347_length_24085_cov_23.240724_13_plen_115_part_00